MSGYPTGQRTTPGSLPPNQINKPPQGQRPSQMLNNDSIQEKGPYHPQPRPEGPPAFHPQQRPQGPPAFHPQPKAQPGSAPYRHQPGPGPRQSSFHPQPKSNRSPNGFTPGPPKGKR